MREVCATEPDPRIVHNVYMAAAMYLTERLLGVPYGPAPCEARPNPKRGLMITGDPRDWLRLRGSGR